MSTLTVFQRIAAFNQGRDPELLKLKYQRMAASAFAFLRGSCHLFYEDWPQDSPLNQAPLSWLCGDLHLENFGSYQGDNHLTYFDINDFDESVLAPNTLDLTRLITSLFLAVEEIKDTSIDPWVYARLFLETYAPTLRDGKARWVERDTAEGLVKDLLKDAENSDRSDFLDKKAPLKGKDRKIAIVSEKTRSIPQVAKDSIKSALKQFAKKQKHPEFFDVIDIAWRIAGTGSLGLDRYLVLVAGNGSPDKNHLLDLKVASPASLPLYLKFSQPQWDNEGQRIIANQNRIQAITPAFLHPLAIADQFFVMRDYQPSEDKIELAKLDQDSLEKLIVTLAEVVAWSQLRSSGRIGSANADALRDFSQSHQWQEAVLEYAHTYSQKVIADHQAFCQEVPLSL